MINGELDIRMRGMGKGGERKGHGEETTACAGEGMCYVVALLGGDIGGGVFGHSVFFGGRGGLRHYGGGDRS